jgi:uncharacterized protein (TIGR01319 family)
MPADLSAFCITDVGSTTTKARLFAREGNGWSVEHAESPTTVERPYEDVTVGVQRAFETLERQTGRALWSDGRPAVPYLSTSSAGGGLAMVVTGLVTSITSRSAQRVALGAGAIVLDILAMDDGRTPYGKVQALEALRPDIVLLAGGFDGENISGPVFLAEMLNEAALRPKLSAATKLPVIYAGNAQAASFVLETLSERFAVSVVDNLRPGADRENLTPAHDAIHETFMEHVMSQAPGYPTLLGWVAAPVLPTPAAFGAMLALASRTDGSRILAIDIGGATTDVFTAERGVVQRTVSANLGMSYSILQVLRRVGVEAVCALLDPPMDPGEVVDRIGGKLLHPTRLPATENDARVERAVAALAIREALRDHLQVLRGVSLDRSSEDLKIRSVLGGVEKAGAQDNASARRSSLKPEPLRGYSLVIGSGGILSHALPGVAARILVEGLQPDDRVELAVDRGFVIPHLGVLASVQPDLAVELFRRVALARLGTARESREAGSDRWTRSSLGTALAAKKRRAGPAGRSEEMPPRGSTANTVAHEPHAASAAFAGDTTGAFTDDTTDDITEGITNVPTDTAISSPEYRSLLIRVRRELVIPGEVRVCVGEAVRSETVVARCTRLFPRPFFLRPAPTLQCAPEETASYLLKKRGDLIEAGALIARRKTGSFSSKEFHSTVAGTIERILPDGTVVVRERPEMAQEAWLVDAARDLAIPAGRLAPYLRCHLGQEVEKGQWLAAEIGRGVPRVSCSPGRGRVEAIDAAKGTIRVHPLREELQVTAWLPGLVVELTPRGAVIEGNGIELAGAWGTGQETAGPLVFGNLPAKREGRAAPGGGDATRVEPGSIVVHDGCVTRAHLETWTRDGVAGVIAASAQFSELLDWAPPHPLVLIEGFGTHRLPIGVRTVLTAHAGGWTLLDGTTEIRVGVRRPRIILVFEPPDRG